MSLDMIQQNAKTFLEAAYEREQKIRAGDRKNAEQLSGYMKSLVSFMRKSLEEEKKAWLSRK